ncbi:hypothetical protein Fot_26682 [Forsythia ovata]|uniref:Uncharacterized protein n=1 Tax=Forsythia ovata TaxID=205694 RepID=A0ABD1UCL4_9LAMI
MGQTSSPFQPVRPFSSGALISATIISRPKISRQPTAKSPPGLPFAKQKPAALREVPILFRRLPFATNSSAARPIFSAGCHSRLTPQLTHHLRDPLWFLYAGPFSAR